MRQSSAPPAATSHLTRHGHTVRVYRATLDIARERAAQGLRPLDVFMAQAEADLALMWLRSVAVLVKRQPEVCVTPVCPDVPQAMG